MAAVRNTVVLEQRADFLPQDSVVICQHHANERSPIHRHRSKSPPGAGSFNLFIGAGERPCVRARRAVSESESERSCFDGALNLIGGVMKQAKIKFDKPERRRIRRLSPHRPRGSRRHRRATDCSTDRTTVRRPESAHRERDYG